VSAGEARNKWAGDLLTFDGGNKETRNVSPPSFCFSLIALDLGKVRGAFEFVMMI
jgi:hypothetical protein